MIASLTGPLSEIQLAVLSVTDYDQTAGLRHVLM
jgi:hypothetical protein